MEIQILIYKHIINFNF